MKRAVSPSLWVLFTAFVVLVAGPGCKPNTRDNPEGCDLYPGDVCPMGQICDHANYRCIPVDAGTAGQGLAGADGTGGVGAVSGGGGAGGGSTGQGGMPADGGVDAPTTRCSSSADCKGKLGTPACDLTTNTCVPCVDDTTCGDTTPACDTTTDTCVPCTTTNTIACTATTALCEPATHQCVECVGDTDCKAPEKSFCTKNACAACADSDACTTRDPSKPVCATSGACVECDKDTDCHGTTPFCGPEKTCLKCGDTASGKSCGGTTPVCAASGACVQCGEDADCSPTSTTPFCSEAGSCVGCGAAPHAHSCMMLTPSTPACSTTGACVQCVASSDCPDGKPVCSSANACGACASDADCTGRGPGVCLSNLDGRCASDKETIYVQNNSSCSDTASSSGGTAIAPFCSMQAATAAVSNSRAVIVVRGTVGGASVGVGTSVSIIGQSSGTILGSVNPALHVTAGITYARDLKLQTAGSIGCEADAGSTVKLNHVYVTGNSGGGILLNGAGFDIYDTFVTNNGPGTVGPTTWGGIFVNMPPPAGPALMRLTTVQTNNPVGISCSTSIAAGATGVLASGSTSSVDIGSTCGITSCAAASATCGAQP